MVVGDRRSNHTPTEDQISKSRITKPQFQRFSRFFFVLLVFLAQLPIVSAHGESANSSLSQWHGLIVVLGGVLILGGTLLLKRSDYLSATVTIHAVFVGIVVTAAGAILFEGLAPDPTYTASSMPFPRSWYQPLSLSIGMVIVLSSFIIGWIRWPTRPRYMSLGMLMGLWILYPNLLPGQASDSHPLGYVIVLGTPLLVGYILWKDTGPVLGKILQDQVARRFGIGVGAIMALFFMATTGYLSFILEEGAPHESTIAIMSVRYQLVMWPTLEVLLPQVPLFFALSIGVIAVVGLLSALVGLNAAVIAYYWRAEEQAGMTQSTAGSAAIVGACTCGCCGPLVSQIAIVAAGPTIAAPLYWVFVDAASPFSSVFIIASILLFTGTLIHSVKPARFPPRSVSNSALSAD